MSAPGNYHLAPPASQDVFAKEVTSFTNSCLPCWQFLGTAVPRRFRFVGATIRERIWNFRKKVKI